MRQLFLIPSILLAAACQVNRAPTDDNITVADVPEENQTISTGNDIPAAPPSPATNQASTPSPVDPAAPPPLHLDPDAQPVPAEISALGAARRVLEYCDALATQRFGDAWRLWSDGGKASGLTEAQFREKYRGVRISDCVIGTPDEMQGAAGSIYIEVPNRFRGTDRNGRALSIDGPVVLRRVNDVDGSTAEQRRWHIARAEFPPQR